MPTLGSRETRTQDTSTQGAIRLQLAMSLLDLLNREELGVNAIREILSRIKDYTGFEAVAIRLRDTDDYPYYETKGFPAHFVEAERSLCAWDDAGQLIRDSNGEAVHECMCGNVIHGRTNPALPFFTEGGSFWSNCTTALLATTTEEDRQAHTRNRCNSEGYETVGLIPLRQGDGQVIGLLQLNDRRNDMLSLDEVHFLEGLGSSIGIAIARKRQEEALASAARLDLLTGLSNRFAVEEILKMEIPRVKRYKHSIGVMIIDVNRFKEVNDRFGHVTGDRVLQGVADVLRHCTRESDVVARWGGDEFLILLLETKDMARVVKERIDAEVAERNLKSPLLDFPVTLAVGAVDWTPESGTGIDAILAEADRLMYEDKRRTSA